MKLQRPLRFAAYFRGSTSEASKIAPYETDPTDAQWALIKHYLSKAKKRNRPRTDAPTCA